MTSSVWLMSRRLHQQTCHVDVCMCVCVCLLYIPSSPLASSPISTTGATLSPHRIFRCHLQLFLSVIQHTRVTDTCAHLWWVSMNIADVWSIGKADTDLHHPLLPLHKHFSSWYRYNTSVKTMECFTNFLLRTGFFFYYIIWSRLIWSIQTW